MKQNHKESAEISSCRYRCSLLAFNAFLNHSLIHISNRKTFHLENAGTGHAAFF